MDQQDEELVGALRLQLQEMGYQTETEDHGGPIGQFSLYSPLTDEWWVVTLVGACQEGDLELARHFRSDRDDRLGYFTMADPKCFERMDGHIKVDTDAPKVRTNSWRRWE